MRRATAAAAAFLIARGKAAAAGRSAGEWALFAAGLIATAAVTVVLARAARKNLEQARGA